MKWNEIHTGHKFSDGSVVTQRHQTEMYECYKLFYNNKETVFSKDHLLLIDISELEEEYKKDIEEYCIGNIPLKEDILIEYPETFTEVEEVESILRNGGFLRNLCDDYYVYGTTILRIERKVTETESQKVDNNHYWLPVEGIHYLLQNGQIIYCNDIQLEKSVYVGSLPCFCVSTDTGRYCVNDLTNHNSVTINNIISACIQHNNKVRCALIDPKQTEFMMYKGMKGVVAVATDVFDSREVLRIARVVMHKRNKKMSELGIKKVADYKPKQKTGKVWITGREYYEQDKIKLRDREITAAELVELTRNAETEVCLKDDIWLPVNQHCVDFIYADEMYYLISVVDEIAELTMKDKVSKEKDNAKDEIMSLIMSITQLGRSAGVLMMLATQKPKADIIPTTIRSNPLALDTLVTTKKGIKPISELTKRDKIRTIDNKWSRVHGVTEEHIPNRMFRITFSNGYVECSDTHQWSYTLNSTFVTDTLDLFENKSWYIDNNVKFGRVEDNVTLLDVEEIEPKAVKCITTKAKDNLFEIVLK